MRFTKQMRKSFTNIGLEPYKYDNGKIYKITSPHTDKVYVGSTIRSLKERLRKHLDMYKRYQNGKSKNKMSSFQLFDLGDYEIELIEHYPCNNKRELELREGYWIRNENCINRCVAGRTNKQYCQDNKEQISQKRKEYHLKNKEQLSLKKKEYYLKNKEKIAEKSKLYCINNKEQISQRRKQCYSKNRERISQKKKQKYTCECGSCLRLNDKARHEQTKKHQNFINQ